jgi:hypothetical protein
MTPSLPPVSRPYQVKRVQIASLEVQERTKNSCPSFRHRQEPLECSRREGRMAITLSAGDGCRVFLPSPFKKPLLLRTPFVLASLTGEDTAAGLVAVQAVKT